MRAPNRWNVLVINITSSYRFKSIEYLKFVMCHCKMYTIWNLLEAVHNHCYLNKMNINTWVTRKLQFVIKISRVRLLQISNRHRFAAVAAFISSIFCMWPRTHVTLCTGVSYQLCEEKNTNNTNQLNFQRFAKILCGRRTDLFTSPIFHID